MKTYYCPKHGRQNGSGLRLRNVDDSGHYYHICPTCYSKYPSHDYQSDSSSPLHIIAGTPFQFFPQHLWTNQRKPRRAFFCEF